MIGLFSRTRRYIAAFVLAVGVLFGVYTAGKSAQRQEDIVEDLEDYIETRKEIDNVETSPTRDAAIDRLRRNGWTG